MKLLCIDSEPVYQEIITLCSENEGLDVQVASSFQQAIDCFETWQPDLVTLDVVIQGGSGLELVKKFKELTNRRFVPVIFLTSHTSDAMMNQCFKSGADDFIPKPFNDVLFNTRLRTHIKHVELVQEMYRKNRELTYYQAMIEREHEMAHQVFDHIQKRSENHSPYVAITQLSAANFNGDLALVKTRPDGVKLAFVGDFTGHGLSASIGALPITQAFFDGIDEYLGLEELSARVNRVLLGILPDYMFCAGYLILIYPNGELEYWGGGMPNAVIRREDGTLDYLKSAHMPLGVLPTDAFDDTLQVAHLTPQDTLIIASDGVYELKNENGVMLGSKELEKLISSCYKKDILSDAQTCIESALLEYQLGAEQLDDITLLAIRLPLEQGS